MAERWEKKEKLPFHFGAVLLSRENGVGRNAKRGVTAKIRRKTSVLRESRWYSGVFRPARENAQGVFMGSVKSIIHFDTALENKKSSENIFGGSI